MRKALADLDPHRPIKEQGIDGIQAMDLGWYMSASKSPDDAIGPRIDEQQANALVDLYDATPHEIKLVIRAMWREILDVGVSSDEFDRRYPLAKAQKETGGPDLDWYDALEVEARFNRLLNEVRTRHTWATGKTHDPVGYYWLEDDDSPAKIERFTREVEQIPEKTLDYWRKNEPDQLREEYRA
jgi:hypothetical protein